MIPRPLYVDLDQSLIRTDILWELAAQMVCRKPVLIPLFLWGCLRGRARLKSWLAAEIKLPVEHLPWNPSVLTFIRSYKAAGGPVILATATHESVACRIAAHLGVFDGVLATTEECNLKGKAKLAAIRRHCGELGADSFAYVGDSVADIPIWQAAEEAWVVPRGGGRAEKAARQSVSGLKSLPQEARSCGWAWFRLLRPQQWSKNSLLALPLILAHRTQDAHLVCITLLAIAAFSLTASAIYILNDFADVFRDRAHPRKRSRPLASGEIPLWQAPFVLLGLCALAVTLAAQGVGAAFTGMLGVYFLSNLLYTFWIKHLPVVDVVGLALMYTLRIFAGGVASGLEVSKWLLTFSMFFFLSLAFGKRCQEITLMKSKENAPQRIRGYIPQDLPIIGMSGLSSGFISVMVLALYVRSPEVLKLYRAPDFLWLLCPLMIYWIGRFWLYTGRGILHDDPVLFALKDRTSWIIGLLVLGVLIAAQCFPSLAHFI
ncbi:MAG: UbiA family prenyltransferase [Verrucomicrobiota bacterium]